MEYTKLESELEYMLRHTGSLARLDAERVYQDLHPNSRATRAEINGALERLVECKAIYAYPGNGTTVYAAHPEPPEVDV